MKFKKWIIGASILLVLGTTIVAFITPKTEATCSGTKNCNACKNCKYCGNCSKNGGTCGVCK